jgi:predicted transcriptional regulator of viral defense system
MYLHGLIENIPQVIYTNKEQSRKPRYGSDLTQESLDRAFARPMRKTKQIAQYNRFKIYLLNGKYTGNLGVIDHDLNGITIRSTGLERTLVDAVVRPDYSGGIEEVLKAFTAAKGEASVNKMLAILKKMDYMYPYHQAIGFYLEKAGYKESVLQLVEELGIAYNFYLTYQMTDKVLNDRWKLYVPRRF